MIELSARDARRLAVTGQLLTRPRPADLLAAASGLGAVQVDHTAYVAPNAELVLWSRLGSRTSRVEVQDAVESRRLVEIRGFLRPAQDVALFTAEMAAWPGEDPPGHRVGEQRWVDVNRHARDQILEQLRSDGPLPARELSADFAVDWRSSGWNDVKNVPMMLERLEERGQVAVSSREGRERVWDLAERIYPDDPPVPLAQALHRRALRRLRALGIARVKGPACPAEPLDAGDAGEPALVEGVRGEWRVDPALLHTPFSGRTALLSPLDRLVFDRRRMADLFAFDYALEMYKPAGQRRWGYFALPVLHLDRLVGKVDAQADRGRGVLCVDAVHEDVPWSGSLRGAVEGELRSLARFLDLDLAFDGRS
ncbi:DNA glycosylase AlkZ-like family protein [Ornithinimicrobium kibberense]|uniref:DNA glycosylase AlkZ-like family protein n=1 Tax=Ornithinimicrobium kibberense TaxID=282060 RepID=A0ABV5UZB7_9MICO|nr:crosslink repair DNA glycosylase YcaQ family protein [Ornithinimicrobium kibberense]